MQTRRWVASVGAAVLLFTAAPANAAEPVTTQVALLRALPDCGA